MAWVMYYPVAAAGTYFIGRNILFRGTTYAIDYILNSNADPDIKETHTVATISSMLRSYEDLPKNHPAYESKRAVEQALMGLQDVVDRARLRLSVHESGWLTRWRTFDARSDNLQIESKARELMSRLDIFTKLIQCPELPPLSTVSMPHNKQYQNDHHYHSYTEKTDTIADEEDIVPIAPVTTLSFYNDFRVW
jgi:hypothetical protein